MKLALRNSAYPLLGILAVAFSCLGLGGGPDYGTSVSVTGTYAGVLFPHPCSSVKYTSGSEPTGRCGANSIAIFSLVAPPAGSAKGPLVIFNLGETYTGTITGTADPRSGKISGLLSGSFPYQATVLSSVQDTYDANGKKTGETRNYTTTSYSASASGQMNAVAATRSNGFGSSGTRLNGTADIQFSLTVDSVDDDIWYDVSGFLQSTTTSSSSTGSGSIF